MDFVTSGLSKRGKTRENNKQRREEREEGNIGSNEYGDRTEETF